MSDIDIRNNVYYKRLDKLLLWPIVGLTALVLIISVSLFVIFNQYYIPEVSLSINQAVSSEVEELIEDGYYRIATTLFVWVGVLLLINSLLIYVVWNVKKLIIELNNNAEDKASGQGR